ncbi:uncharacterized protein F4812DRAFT_464669 [Daldinia caldariorum]|uniref:uncharacterized protein n=1 Tax=Daldinia caldariorum TaxID=326644 RepID=UPI002008E9E4|nr:uncharacterized protein F4812DRAFT_464669 [Daldinia caldariorum]KAI1472574.1 hypothetical protein F4812DRAFT_464669 [Daldinia caldariorum]
METHLSQQPDQSSSSQRQYTTVGSVWHPQSMPMQPPARRGRALRSAMPMPMSALEPYSDDSFNAFGTAHPYSQPHHYSPLQQNFDRAVSPVEVTRLLPPDPSLHLDHPRHLDNLGPPGSPVPKRVTEFTKQYSSTPSVDMSQQVTLGISQLSLNTVASLHKDNEVNNHHGRDSNTHENGGEEGEDCNISFNNMSTKTLTNLASYSNPMQKAAQKILTRARQAPSMPHHQISDSISQNAGDLNVPFGLGSRNIRSEQIGGESLLHSDRLDGRSTIQHLGPPHVSVATTTTRERGSYPAVLSKGPGAPQPLTAGPPGQRNFQPSNFNGAPNSLQKSFDKSCEYDTFYDGAPRHHPLPPFQSQQPTQPTPQQPNPSYKSVVFPSSQPRASLIGKCGGNSTKMIDTLTHEEARRFFPKGLPTDFNFDTQQVGDDWAAMHLKEEEEKENSEKYKLLWQQPPEFQIAYKAKLDRDFYNGNYMINKNLRAAIHEKNTRDITRSLGSKYQEPWDNLRPKPEGKIDGRYISVEDANAIPTREHAESLLSVLYQSLDRSQGFSSQQKPPTGGGLR